MNAAGLQEETRRVWEGSSPLPRAVEAPEPGDVFVLEELAEFDLEWAVLERQPSTGRLLVVAADGQPLVGSADVEVPASQPGGPLVLRCRFGGWVDAGAFKAATRTGTLGSDVLVRARDRRALIESGQAVTGSGLALEVDDETPYLAWIRETLEPAWKALARLGPAESKPALAAPDSSASKPASRRRRSRHGARVLALAATVLLALAATTFWRQHVEILEGRNAAAQYRREVGELRREQERLESEHQRKLDEAKARYETETQRRLDELGLQLEALSSQNAVFNPVVESLQPTRGRRGRGKTVRLHAGASHLLLAVALEEPGRLYRAELLDRATDEIVWEKSDLKRESLGLWIGPPAALIPPGEYLLRIFELTGGASGPAAEYPLNIMYEQQ